MRRPLTEAEIERQLPALSAWKRDGMVLRASFAFDSFPDVIRAVDEIALVAEEIDHHPDLDIRWRTLHVALTTHSAGALTQLDIEAAYRVDECVRDGRGRPA